MTTETIGGASIPAFELGHRMALSLEAAQITRGQMAREMGTTTEAIRRWTQGLTEPKRHVLIAWSVLCGVNLGWLETGQPVEPALRARRDSNPQPSDSEPVLRLINGPRVPVPSTQPRPTLRLAWSVQADFTPERGVA